MITALAYLVGWSSQLVIWPVAAAMSWQQEVDAERLAEQLEAAGLDVEAKRARAA